jgi:hypothetical protein
MRPEYKNLMLALGRCLTTLVFDGIIQRYAPSGYDGYFEWESEHGYSEAVLSQLPEIAPNVTRLDVSGLLFNVTSLQNLSKMQHMVDLRYESHTCAFEFRSLA